MSNKSQSSMKVIPNTNTCKFGSHTMLKSKLLLFLFFVFFSFRFLSSFFYTKNMQRNNNFEIPPGYTNEQFQEPITSACTTTLVVRDHT